MFLREQIYGHDILKSTSSFGINIVLVINSIYYQLYIKNLYILNNFINIKG